MHFHTDSTMTVARLTEVLLKALGNERRVRFDIDHKGRLRYKIGEGMWSEPIESTPDPSR